MYDIRKNELTFNDKFELKVCSLRTLKNIVNQSIINKYNRVIDYDLYFKTLKKAMIKEQEIGFWNGKNTNVLIQPIMVHQHANLERVEDHMRCLVQTGGQVKDVYQDIPMNLFNELDSFKWSSIKKSLSELRQ